MQQVKIFKGTELDLVELERQVNEWITENGVRVIQMVGNIAPQGPKQDGSSMLSKTGHAPSDVLLVVLYEKA